MKTFKLIVILTLITTNYALGQQKENQVTTKNNNIMKTYVIERIIPGAGDLTPEQLKGISQTSCTVLKEMGPIIEWQHSYATGDKVYCVYKAENKKLIEEDFHDLPDGVTAAHVAEMHQSDLKIEHKYNCRGLTYWCDERK